MTDPGRGPSRRPTESFRFVAARRSGEEVEGQLEASDRATVERHLKERDLVLVRAEVDDDRRPVPRLAGVRDRDLIHLAVQLLAYASAGVGLPGALEDIASDLPGGRLRRVVLELARVVRSGEALTAALERHPNVFEPIVVRLVESGEVSGNLPEALRQVVAYLEARDAMAREVRRVVFYPLVLLVASGAVLALLFGWTLPRIFGQLEGASPDIPWLPALVRGFSFWVADHGSHLFFALGLGLGTYTLIGATRRGRLALDRAWLGAPIHGRVRRELAAARFVRVYRTLLAAGLDAVRSLDLAGRAMGNAHLERRIGVARDRILLDGATLTEALERSGALPGLVVRMFRAGEGTGQLEQTLSAAHEFYEAEIPRRVAWFLRWLDLGVLVAMGGVVLVVLISVFQLLIAVSRQAAGF